MEKNLIKFLLQQNGNNARKATAKNGIRAHQQQLQFVVAVAQCIFCLAEHLLKLSDDVHNLQLVWYICVCVCDTR